MTLVLKQGALGPRHYSVRFLARLLSIVISLSAYNASHYFLHAIESGVPMYTATWEMLLTVEQIPISFAALREEYQVSKASGR